MFEEFEEAKLCSYWAIATHEYALEWYGDDEYAPEIRLKKYWKLREFDIFANGICSISITRRSYERSE